MLQIMSHAEWHQSPIRDQNNRGHENISLELYAPWLDPEVYLGKSSLSIYILHES